MNVAKLTVGTKYPSALVKRFTANSAAVFAEAGSKTAPKMIVKNPTTFDVGREIELKQVSEKVKAIGRKYDIEVFVAQRNIPSVNSGAEIVLKKTKPKKVTASPVTPTIPVATKSPERKQNFLKTFLKILFS